MTAPSLWRRFRNTLRNPRRKRVATIDISAEDFVLTFRGRATRTRWAEVTRIDAGVRDYLSFDALYVLMVAGDAAIEIDELDDGFRQFETILLERWPQIGNRWKALLSAAPQIPQHETLWQRGA